MKIKKFEEIEAWKRARQLTKEVYRMARRSDFCRDWGLRDQVCRSAISITSNIAEGFDSSSRNEFARFLNIARRSASELQSQSYVALDQLYINEEEFKCLYQQAEEVRKMITALIMYLKGFTR